MSGLDGASPDPPIERVGVVGCGLMGSGIAEVCARAELPVTVVEASPEAAAAGRARIDESLSRAVTRGKLSSADRDAVADRITIVTDLAALADRDLVVEAVAENETAKIAVFTALDTIIERPDAILATNTSSIPVIKLGAATSRPEQVVGIHFFNPVPVLPLVELVPSLLTSQETLHRAATFATHHLGKEVIHAQDRAGFVVNALLIPYLLNAVRMLESGLADVEDIDRGMVLGCAHPLGPLALADLIGLDTVHAIAESLYEEFKEGQYSPPPLLARMVDARLLGRKSGHGFHRYR